MRILFFLAFFSFFSCEVDNYDCYTFEVNKEIVYVPDGIGIPYRPPYYSSYFYDRCGISSYLAKQEAKGNEYILSYYSQGYYITEKQSCSYWRNY